MDSLVLYEACVQGKLNHIPRRPHDRERGDLIRSGNVFIYQEDSSGIKRWTDGYNWSPSRILGNFLIYRELDRAFPPGEKKKAMKKKANANSRGSVSKDPRAPSHSNDGSYGGMPSPNPPAQSEIDRTLIGSLVDSYAFKEDGLIKKTISVTINEINHHMVSYYTMTDVKSGLLRMVHEDPLFQAIYPRSELLHCPAFRNPIDNDEVHYRRAAFPERDEGYWTNDASACYGYPQNPMQQQQQQHVSHPQLVHQQQLAQQRQEQQGHHPAIYDASGWTAGHLPGSIAYPQPFEVSHMGTSQMQPLHLSARHHPALPAGHHSYSQEARHTYDMNPAQMRPMQTTSQAPSLAGYRVGDGEYDRRVSMQYGQALPLVSEMGSMHSFENHGDQMGELAGPATDWNNADDYGIKGEDDRHII
ncbi:Gti1/Pac2 family-domain-containing protein [Lasiosphaeria hispida]|uniref:Gti1/Pac2 family-domain-containing protein n=1 Tax=Lasiosphaeria hispida TaxID=260671 RepID=A0AAJ0MG62_9PEZI|nr:Gti1/Pac2 family-domain-containing protein [Lasiosphaeria hispida]